MIGGGGALARSTLFAVLLAAGCQGSQKPAATAERTAPAAPQAAGTSAPASRTGAFSEAEALALPFETFDRTPDQGWRVLADQDRWLDAAKLIDRYIAVHPELTAMEQVPLNFHAGQMYAFAGENALARNRFTKSLIPNQSPDAPIQWNAYVLATIAFLEGDMTTLEQSRGVILGGAIVQGCKPNLNIVNSLIANVGKPYKVAYQAAGPPTLK